MLKTEHVNCYGCSQLNQQSDLITSENSRKGTTTMAAFEQEVDRGIELLTLCQQLQSEKDGVDRPAPLQIDKSKTLDRFAQDIGQAINNMAALRMLMPMMERLADLGRKLEKSGRITVDYGDSYSEKALEFFVAEYGSK